MYSGIYKQLLKGNKTNQEKKITFCSAKRFAESKAQTQNMNGGESRVRKCFLFGASRRSIDQFIIAVCGKY